MKIALITGASSGLGREFARQIPKLYRKLDEIWLAARSTDKLNELAKELPLPARIFDGDLTRDYIYDRIKKELERQSADIRMLVNAAGYGAIGDATDIDVPAQAGMIDLNCRALTKMTLLCIPYMSKGSRIIQMASAAAFAPQPGFAVYAATKSYVYSFARGLGGELKTRGIITTVVCPGPVDTAFFERAGNTGNSLKWKFMSGPVEVVHKALADAANRRETSVYGAAMKAARIAARLLPDRLVIRLMRADSKKQNKGDERIR